MAATLLLVLMGCVFAAMLYIGDVHPAVPWVRSFAEAAMVGGLADWFAVTALFRHPLGLPIPHTAIIPANKDRIGESLASFLKDNFLTPSVVARQLEGVDMAGAAARWLATPATRGGGGGGGRRSGIGPMLAQIIGLLDDPRIGEMVRTAAADRMRAMALSPVVADAVDATLDKRRHEPLLDAAIDWALMTLDDQQSTIRAMVKGRTNWLLRAISVDTQVSESLINGVRSLLYEVRSDPFHSLRGKLETGLRNWAFDLRHFPDSQGPVETFKADLIDNPALGGWISGLWDSARAGIVRRLSAPASGEGGDDRLGSALAALGQRIEGDAALRHSLNLQLRRLLVGLVNRYGEDIVALVSNTVRSWDASTVTEKLETAVGRDLQFIRINGTLIGGTIGLAIHAVRLSIEG
ncbi:uncharacterized membrane-anchored protein YjiN (DUF445 family) [Polymorphobacter multimanifer]|uniref:Uncharacterized membrane-anchored protein YjiN (DUF445 family) n=1 Tax=Polymorphobacter multimanifer TaxID=1070431 RepID=A0A841L1E2_9SPHN|nr:uncharacterized membrane-anchored protein YjiN (DUF445 family) [Polymorphobacter multimanifer]